MSDLTDILAEISQDESPATEAIFPFVYDELRRIAHRRMRQERAGHSLQTSDLLHEAFLRLVGGSKQVPWENRRHFFAAATEAMRRILIEAARRKQRRKHGGGFKRVSLDHACPATAALGSEILAVDEAIEKLTKASPQRAELVKLRFFAGMTIHEASQTLGISHATAERYWAYARAWLYCELNRGNVESNESATT